MKKIESILKKHWQIILLTLFTIFIHFVWFAPHTYIHHGDWQRFTNDVSLHFGHFNNFSWYSYKNFGWETIQFGFFIFFLPVKIIGSFEIGNRLLLFIPTAILSFWIPFWFSLKLSNNKNIAFITSLYFGLHTNLLAKQTGGQILIALPIVLAPLILIVYSRLIKEVRFSNIIYFSLLFFISASLEIRMTYIISGMLLLYTIFFFRKELFTKKIIPLFIIPPLLIIYIFLPVIFSESPAISEKVERPLFGNWLFDIFHAMTLTVSSWTGGEPAKPFTMQPVPIYFWFIPMIAFAALLKTGKGENIPTEEKKHISFFAILSLLGIFLTKQSGDPFPDLYGWLYKNLPGFNLFREASKFYILTAVGYLGLLTYSLKHLIVENSKLSKLQKKIAFIFLILLFGYNAKPYITKEAGGMFVSKEFPVAYIEPNSIIKDTSKKQPIRTISFPRSSQWQYFSARSPMASAFDLRTKDLSFYYPEQNPSSQAAEFLIDPFLEPYGEELSSIANFQYFIIPIDDKHEQQPLFQYYQSPRQDYINKIQEVGFIKEVAPQSSYDQNVLLFKNDTQLKGPIWASASLLKIHDRVNAKNTYTAAKFFQSNFAFVTNDFPIITKYQIQNPFQNITSNSIIDNDILPTISSESFDNSLQSSILIKSSLEYSLNYEIQNGEFLLYTVFNSSFADEKTSPELIAAISLPNINQNQQIALKFDNRFLPISFKQDDQATASGVVLDHLRDISFQLYIVDSTNLIQDPSFENSLWQEEVGDCHNYDDNPILSMERSNHSSDGNYSLMLEAKRHTACTFQDINVSPASTYEFSFDIKSSTSQRGHYLIGFLNPDIPPVQEIIPIDGEEWQTVVRTFETPKDISQLRLHVYGYPQNQKSVATFYDNFSLKKTTFIHSFRIQSISQEETFDSYDKPIQLDVNPLEGANILSQVEWRRPQEEGCSSSPNQFSTSYQNNEILNQEKHYTLSGEAGTIPCIYSHVTGLDYNLSYSLSLEAVGSNTSQKTTELILTFNDSSQSKEVFLLDELNNDWKIFEFSFQPPPGANQAEILLRNPLQEGEKTSFKNFILKEQPTKEDEFTYITFTEKNFTYPIKEIEQVFFRLQENSTNIINNPSFEEGFWQEIVGDCHNYDDNPIIDMKLSNATTDREKSLQLEAERHIACTTKRIQTIPNTHYLLSFDYQGVNVSNNNRAGFNINLQAKDNNKPINETLKISSDNWNTYSKMILTPPDSHSINLTIYAYASNQKSDPNIVRYDNFSLVAIPPIQDNIILVSEDDQKYNTPEINYEIVSNTEKLVLIRSATTPFYLNMSEAYHPEWKVSIDNNKNNGLIASWSPFVSHDKIPDKHHYKLNDFLNGWYIDVDTLCREKNLCTDNGDGTYDIDLVIEFWPQRWFTLGLIISGTTLIFCLLYLTYDYAKKQASQRGWR